MIVRIGRVAEDGRNQGRGIGQDLLSFSLQLALEFSHQVGLYAIVVDAKHARAKAFYEVLGFMPTDTDSLCLFLPLGTLRKSRAG